MNAFDRTKPFNQLPVLPPDESLVYSKEVLLKLAEANRSLGKLDGISSKLPNPKMLINTISLQEAKSSSEIENIFTTDDELYKALSTTDTKILTVSKRSAQVSGIAVDRGEEYRAGRANKPERNY